jgi:hypothetical protein
MKKNYTLCFYEYPGALMEIKQWENLKFDSIIHKEIWDDKTRLYEIKLDKDKCDGFEVEILFCIAMDNIGFVSNAFSSVMNTVFNLKLVYYKTIIFGKVDIKWINKIQKIVTGLEKENGK